MAKKIKAKFRKLIRNPRLFFIDFHRKRFPNSRKKHNILDDYINDSLKSEVGAKNSIPKKNNSEGYHFYLNNYNDIDVNCKQIMFDSFWGRSISCHPYAIYQELKKMEEYKDYIFIWVKDPDIIAPYDTLVDRRVVFVDYTSEEYAASLLSSKILISNSNFSPYFSPKPEQIVISTWHGIPMKTLGYDANNDLTSVYNTQRNLNVSDLVVSSSEYYTEKVIKSYGASLAIDNTLILGSPRIDLTINADQKKLRKLLSIPSKKPVLLYAPTWRGKIGSVSNDLDIQLGLINLLEKEYSHKYEIFVSLHHLTKNELGDISKLSIKEVPNHININEFLSICDVVISDYSSIFLDYLVLNRPIILYIPDLEEYKKERGLYLNPDDLPVNIAFTLNDIRELLKTSVIKKPSQFPIYKKIRKALLPYEDGKSSQRVIKEIQKISPNTQYSHSSKKSILISVGGLKNNGITNSLFNLLENIDYNLFEIYLLVNSKIVDSNKSALENLNRLNKKCKYILTIAPQNFSFKQRKIYQKLLKGGDLTENEQSEIYDAFSRENRRLLGKFHFDFVIDYSGYSHYWANLLASSSANRKIIFQHSDMYAEYKNTLRDNEYLLSVFKSYQYYDVLVSVSEEIQALNQKQLNNFANTDKFKCLPNFLAPKSIEKNSNELLSQIAPEAFLLSLEKDLVKFICVARLSPEKGHIRLLKAFQKVLDSGIKASLLIVGDGPMLNELEELCSHLGIENNVVFHGYARNPYPLIKSSDCLVLASDYEGQGLVFLEAMALRVPCIGSDIPVIRNLIVKHGGLVAPLNSDGLANIMIDFCLSSDPQAVEFNIDTYTEQCCNKLYEDILVY